MFMFKNAGMLSLPVCLNHTTSQWQLLTQRESPNIILGKQTDGQPLDSFSSTTCIQVNITWVQWSSAQMSAALLLGKTVEFIHCPVSGEVCNSTIQAGAYSSRSNIFQAANSWGVYFPQHSNTERGTKLNLFSSLLYPFPSRPASSVFSKSRAATLGSFPLSLLPLHKPAFYGNRVNNITLPTIT